MKERPILFSGAMIRAILEGRKTQTRRVIKQVPNYYHLTWHEGPRKGEPRHIMDWGLSGIGQENGRFYLEVQTDVDDCSHTEIECPYGKVGDGLWVREAWQLQAYGGSSDYVAVKYLADGAISNAIQGVQNDIRTVHFMGRPSIHMPRWASRLTLEIVSVRAERLQNITEADAIAEGVTPGVLEKCIPHIEAFRKLWYSINDKRGYDLASNPWVWVVEFRRLP